MGDGDRDGAVIARCREGSVDEGEWVAEQVVAENTSLVGEDDWSPFTILLDPPGGPVGGITGHTHWRWMYVSHLWVSPAHRGKGFGRLLLADAERLARSRSCIRVHLESFSFQGAAPFYERCGYEVVHEFADYPPGDSRMTFRKVLR